MTMILAIDPGPEKSGWVTFSTKKWKVMKKGITPNMELMENIMNGTLSCHALSIEIIVSYGKPMANGTLITSRWVGRFVQCVYENCFDAQIFEYSRPEVSAHIAMNRAAKDSAVNEALRDKFGGQKESIGNKKEPGPLYGISAHMWSALALAVTAAEQHKL